MSDKHRITIECSVCGKPWTDGHQLQCEGPPVDPRTAERDALLAKLRVAVEALTDLDRNYDFHPRAQSTISEALATIGPLPEET